MKKSFLFVAALALVFASCNNEEVVKFEAGFEEAANSPKAPESELVYDHDTAVVFKSGNFELPQVVSWGGGAVSGAVISNRTDKAYAKLADAYKSMAGGAHTGKNYVVWYHSAWTPDTIRLTTAAVVPGMYVCNNSYAYSSITKGDDYAGGPFVDGDYFTLIVGGLLNGVAVNATVEFDLARGTDVVTEWTFVDLSKLGKIDAIVFSMIGSRTGDFGLNTPSYFCIDDLGIKAPEKK
ncbi:MAG: DUF4465 domain-containing protein [Paludibacteraceae bacterium]|nr:DUF4465 domain-containing protein [Paludibacteraceae bacterium]